MLVVKWLVVYETFIYNIIIYHFNFKGEHIDMKSFDIGIYIETLHGTIDRLMKSVNAYCDENEYLRSQVRDLEVELAAVTAKDINSKGKIVHSNNNDSRAGGSAAD